MLPLLRARAFLGSRHRSASRLALALSVPALGAVAACSGGTAMLASPLGDGGLPSLDATIDGSSPLGAGVGQPCDDAVKCRPGLACTDARCAPAHASENGTGCTISAECKQGSYCAADHTCATAGTGTAGAPCEGDAQCASGLRCNVVGLNSECQAEGAVDVGGTCAQPAQCFGGLSCVNQVCAQLPPGQPIPAGWAGVTCDADDPAPTKVYFRVPRGTGDGDFFRLPFPNDVRKKSGKLDLASFPTPGTALIGFDAIDRYLRYIEATADGWSAYPTVTFRFSGGVNFDSLKAKDVLRYVDLTTGDDLGFSWFVTTGRNAYVCQNGLFVRPPAGSPLVPGHTYAVLVTKGAKSETGVALERADDFAAVIAASAPADATLASAHAAYAPLRSWATSKSYDTTTLAGAAVFTVGTAVNMPKKLPAAVAAAAAPVTSGWVKCGSAPSPCPDATGDRACGTGSANYDELHALVSLPIFQQGTAPYKDPADGGDFVLDGTGTPVVQRTENVCLSLTVPKGTAPAAGWPLVIYAHGTGGSFRSHVTEGVADRLATAKNSGNATTPMAVLGIDQELHGPRRGASTETSDKLFYNFANPKAALGNPLQGAADQLALVRMAKALDLPAAGVGASPTGARIHFGAIAFWGHSQGATEGGISLPYSQEITGVVLSGEGASLIDSLLGKKKPVNISAGLPYVLGDPAVGPSHPALAVLQHAIDPADPLHHARFFAATPPVANGGRHVFMPFGQGDSYTPVPSQVAFALAAGLGQAAHAPSVTTPETVGGLVEQVLPMASNLTSGSKTVTAAFRQYAPNGFDGHFVAFQDPNGKADVDRFLADLASGVVPKVGP